MNGLLAGAVVAAIVTFAVAYPGAWFAGLLDGFGALIGFIVALPLWLCLAPYVGGIGGGVISRRRAGTIGSILGVLAGTWGVVAAASRSIPDLAGLDPLLVVVIATLATAGHFTGLAVRRPSPATT